jgi:signal transduction histidine kinase
MLLDHPRRRLLLWSGGRTRSLSQKQVLTDAFALHLKVGEALVFQIPEGRYGAVLLLSGIPGLCSDDLKLADRFREEISVVFERVALVKLTREAAENQTRLSLARDLHDSVVQFLAGMGFRLENLRRTINHDENLHQEIDALKLELIQEQRDLRQTLELLRGGKGPRRISNVSEALQVLTDRAGRQWGVTCSYTSYPPKIEVPAQVEHHVLQLVREAIANAVRHGRAKAISIALRNSGSRLLLEIGDDGTGFPMKAEVELPSGEQKLGPWSLHERVQELGGDLMLISSGKGSRISISLPIGEAA